VANETYKALGAFVGATRGPYPLAPVKTVRATYAVLMHARFPHLPCFTGDGS